MHVGCEPRVIQLCEKAKKRRGVGSGPLSLVGAG